MPYRAAPSRSNVNAALCSTLMVFTLLLFFFFFFFFFRPCVTPSRSYAEYLKTKALRREGDEPLSFSQFMFFSTIRTLPEFLYKKTELAYCMMRAEGDTLVYETNFVRYAPILAPLASKLDARALFLALQGATIAAGAAPTHEQVLCEEMEEAEESALAAAAGAGAGAAAAASSSSSSANDDSPDAVSAELLGAASSAGTGRPARRKAGGVGYAQFRLYVEALKKYTKRGGPDCGWPEVFTSFPEVAAAGPQEQLLLVRTGVTDTTTFPPHIGRMAITTSFLLYESSFFKRKRAIRWSHITRIERNDEVRFAHTHACTYRCCALLCSACLLSLSLCSSASSTRRPTLCAKPHLFFRTIVFFFFVRARAHSSPCLSVAGCFLSFSLVQGFWRKKAAAAVSAVSSSSSAAAAATDKARGINIYVLEEEVVPGGSGGGSGGGGSGSSAGSAGGRSKRAEECLTWDQPGWGSEMALERTRTFEYLRIMLALQRLVATIPSKVVASALVQETCMSLLRMRALEAVGTGTEPLLLNPFSDENIVATRRTAAHAPPLLPVPLSAAAASAAGAGSASSASSSCADPSSASGGGTGNASLSIEPGTASQSFVASIAASISRADLIRKSKSSWLFAVLPGLQDRAKEGLEEDIDPEFAAASYKTAEELALLSRVVEQPFSLRNFAYNVKLFRHEIEPLMQFFALVRRVRDWENPLLTLITVMLLLNMAYRDLLSYLPAMVVLLNIAVVATLKYWPDAIQAALAGKEDAAKPRDDSNGGMVIEDVSDESIMAAVERDQAAEAAAAAAGDSGGGGGGAASSSSSSSFSGKAAIPTAQPVPPSASKKDKDREKEKGGSDNDGLLAKLKNYRDVAVRTKEYLHSVQNTIGEHNVRFMKLEGLYKWRTPTVTQKFFAQLCLVFLVLVFIPFRFIFPVLGQQEMMMQGAHACLHAGTHACAQEGRCDARACTISHSHQNFVVFRF